MLVGTLYAIFCFIGAVEVAKPTVCETKGWQPVFYLDFAGIVEFCRGGYVHFGVGRSTHDMYMSRLWC